MSKGEHHYDAHLIWDGNHGDGTSDYQTYGREYRVLVDGKAALHGTADPAFRGTAELHNPEDLFLAAIASCHMLSYLALCARHRISVTGYEDHASGTMREDGRGGGRFEEVVLRPLVTISDPSKVAKALELHQRAHQLCFIASSCSVPIRHHAEVRT